MATRRPAIATNKAVTLRAIGMVMIGVFIGRKLHVMMRPAIILPQASRFTG